MSSSQAPQLDTQLIETILAAEGFSHFGFAELSTPVSIAFYEQWLKAGYQGEMSYLEKHLDSKREPTRLMARAQSAIVVTTSYLPHPDPLATYPLSDSTRVALYARGRDYHHFIKERLTRVIERLQSHWPEDAFQIFSDSAPVLERDLAHRAGLGWVGKNTCLIDKKRGSLFFIAEIYTSLRLPSAKIEQVDHCGTCTRCLDACPTGALTDPRTLDARRCISYLTIESRHAAPEDLRPLLGDWLFGCDICQTVCPWNIKAHGRKPLEKRGASVLARDAQARDELIQDLRWILTSSNRALEKATWATPLSRAGAMGLKRNALVVIANLKLTELVDLVRALAGHEKLGPLVKWVLEDLDQSRPSSIP